VNGSILALMLGVLGPLFSGESWAPWQALLKATYALPMSGPERELFRAYAGGRTPPQTAPREAWILAGRRAGKSRIASLVAVYATTCQTYTLAPGEVGVFPIIAADRRQARVVKRYVSGLLHAVPELRALIARETASAISLTNGLCIEIHTASFRTVRGYTVIGTVCDEVCYWRDEDSANPDTEILTALRAATATQPRALLLCVSSPYARRGEAWRVYRKHFAVDDARVLVVQVPSRALNPTLPTDVIDAAYEDDPSRAAAEYGAQWRSDVETFLTYETIAAAVVPGRRELPAHADMMYLAFVDPAGSGGANADSFTAAVAHQEGEQVVLDAVFEQRPPFSPEGTVAALCAWLKPYGITSVVGDRYAGEWPREQFRRHGVAYEPSLRTKSDIYREVLPPLNSGRVALLDAPRLIGQLSALERRVSRGGKESIDHAPGAHDDVANAAAGAVVLASLPPLAPGIVWIDTAAA
jgi:hypothetical protein